ncbi:MAG: immunoglobulin domain-containing protein [Candidatus Hydrogenedentes bacterium]|nr:immunoglobulin domain-containing protein [Candidatus Hydrogenedentota bacterium]
MVKLHGSVVLADSGYIECNNHTANTSDTYKGRATIISNMTSPPLPVFSDDYLLGYATNNSVLRASAPYDESIQVPLQGDLANNTVATGGFLKPGFWNQTTYLANRLGSPTIEVVALRNANSPFNGFDQIFVTNNGATVQDNVTIFVDGCDPFVIGTMAPGQVWSTTVPAGRNVLAYTQLQASINESQINTYLGASFTLTATVSGGATPRVTRWRRNGLTVTSGWDQYTFTVNPVLASHAGQYTLEVTDGVGQVVVTDPPVPVTVNAPVSITTQPQSASIVQGGNVVFTVAATGGYPPLSYDWRKDGVSLGKPSLPYLALGPVTPADAGTYDVVITDALGVPVFGQVTSAGAVLTVTTPLAIAAQPVSVIAYADEPQAVFSVTAQGGTPPYAYTWLKDGTPLPPAEQPNGPTLTLNAPLASRAGSYRCVVTDNYAPPAEVQSDPATLTVYPRLVITTQPQGGSFERFTSTTLAVAVTGGAPGRTYLWRKDGVPLPVEQQPQTWALALNNLQYADAGAYDVVVYDGYNDQVTSSPAVITVTPPPALTITAQPQGGTAKIGASWVFAVQTTGGEGAITYQWKFDDGSGPVNVGTSQPYLFLTNLQANMEGVYWVEITDEARTVTSQPAQLTLVSQPLIQITGQPQSTQAPAGGSATFTVAVTGGVYPLQFTWMFDDGSGNPPVPVGDNAPTLTLTDLTRAQSGTYYVEVSDQYETVTSDPATLFVTLAITAQPQGATVRAGDPIELSVVADGGTGTLHYQWKFERSGEKAVVNVGDDSPTLYISEASAEDAGNYWVEISDDNTFVVSDPATIIVLTEPGVPVGGAGLLAFLGVAISAAGAGMLRRKRPGRA